MHVPLTDVVLSHDGVELSRATLAPGEYVIGCDAGADLHANTPLLSRHHARLTINYDHLLLEDLGSSDGTFVNGQPLAAATRVFPSQAIRLGEVKLEIHRQRTPSEPGVSLAPAQAAIQRFVPEELLAEKRYAIGGIVAEGGMGVILDAQQSAMKRTVAMKVMLNGSTEASVLRFIEEAQVTGQLEHPNIVPVHELGVDEQAQLYYTMKFVRGTTLKKVLDLLAAGDAWMVKKYPLSALLTILQKVCDAIAFAHSKSVIHRDIKPENIMLGDFGEVLVLDWGLAKVIGKRPAPVSDPSRSAIRSARVASPAKADEMAIFATMSGSIVGTAQYMAPEQARGEVETLDQRADIYALGGLLYYILALRPAIGGSSVEAILTKVRAGKITPLEKILTRPRRARPAKAATQPAKPPSAAAEQDPTVVDSRPPPSPAALRSDEPQKATIALAHLPGERVPESLSAVCMKALALETEERYQRVESLQADLSAYQSGFATSAESASGWRQFTLLLKRHKAVSTAVAASLLLLAAVSAIYTTQVLRANAAATSQRDLAEDRVYFSHMLLAGKDLTDGRPENARQLLDRHFSEPSGRDRRGWEWYYLYGQLSQATLRVEAHRGGANAVAVSPDGTKVATVGDDGTVALWSAGDLRELARWRVDDGGVLSVAWDREGARLVTGTAKGQVIVWDAATHAETARLKLGERDAVRAVAWEPADATTARVAIGSLGSGILLWQPANTAAEILGTAPHGTSSLAWSADGRRLAAGLLDTGNATAVFNVATKQRVFSRNAPAGSDIYAVAFDKKSGQLAVGAKHLILAVYDLASQAPVFSRPIHRGFVTAVTWHPDGHLLASGGYDGTIRLTDLRKPDQPPAVLTGNIGKVQGLAWATIPAPELEQAPARVLYSTSSDGALCAWLGDRVGGQTFATEMTNWVAKSRWNPEGTLLAVVSYGNEVRLYDPSRGTLTRTLRAGVGNLFDVAWSPDGRWLAAASRGSGSVRIFDVKSGEETAVLKQLKPTRLSWSPDSRHLAVGGSPAETRVWEIAEKKLVVTIPRASGDLSWHPDGGRLALGGRDGSVEIWNPLTGQQLASWRPAQPDPVGAPVNEFEPPRQVATIAWSATGDRLAIGTQDSFSAIFDSQSGTVSRALSGHTGAIYALRWSPDGSRIVTGGQDGSVRVFNSVTGDQVAEIPHGTGLNEVPALDWTHDGRRVLTGGFDRFVRVWDTSPGHDLAEITQLDARLARQPDDLETLTTLAEHCARAGFADRARGLFGKALALRPGDSALVAAAQQTERRLASALFSKTGRVAPAAKRDSRLEGVYTALGSAAAKAEVTFADDASIELRLTKLGISDLSPLRGLPIKRLYAASNPLADLSPLDGLPLEVLWLCQCKNVTDFAPLAKCPQLQSIHLCGTGITDLAPLRGLPLRYLKLSATPVADLSPLAGLPIETLHLDSCKNLTDLSPLAKFPRLLDVNLYGSGIRDIEAIKGLSLNAMGVGKTAVTDLSPLRGSPLVSLNFEEAPVTDVSPLLNCPKLRRVLLSRSVKNVEVLRQHPGLTHISYDWDNSKGIPAQTREEFWADFGSKKP